MKYAEPNQNRIFTLLALVLTLALASIYYSPDQSEEPAFSNQSSPIETTN